MGKIATEYIAKIKAENRELKDKVKRLTSRGFEDLHFENNQLKAENRHLHRRLLELRDGYSAVAQRAFTRKFFDSNPPDDCFLPWAGIIGGGYNVNGRLWSDWLKPPEHNEQDTEEETD